MKLNLRQSPKHHQVRVTVRTPRGELVTYLDDSSQSLTVTLPPDVHEDEVEAWMEFLDSRGNVDTQIGAHVLKTKLRKRRGKKPAN